MNKYTKKSDGSFEDLSDPGPPTHGASQVQPKVRSGICLQSVIQTLSQAVTTASIVKLSL